jgi:hypothetical protein
MFLFSLNLVNCKKEVWYELRKNRSVYAVIFVKPQAVRCMVFFFSYLTDKRQPDDLLSFYYTLSRLLSLRSFVGC